MSALEKLIVGVLGAVLIWDWLDPEMEDVELEYEPAIGKLNAYRFTPVYKELPTANNAGKTNIRFAYGKSGTYIIKEDSEIVYVGQSGYNLYNTIMRHFAVWHDRGEDRISYRNSLNHHRYTVRIVFASPTRAMKLEEALIRKYRPRDNSGKLFMMEPEPAQEAAQEAILEEYQAAEYEYPPEWD